MADNFTTKYIDYALDALNIRTDLLPDNPEVLFGDGVTYSDKLHWQSPEGNHYGQRKIVKEYYVPVMWDGENYRIINVVGTVASASDLPLGHQRSWDFWTVTNRNSSGITLDVVVYYYNPDAGEWREVEWSENVYGKNNLPYPGRRLGAGHYIVLKDVEVIWNGFRWVKHPKHSTLEDDEPDRHLPEGFIKNYEDQVSDTHGRIMNVDSLLSSHALANEKAHDGIYFDLDGLEEVSSVVSQSLSNIEGIFSGETESITKIEANSLEVSLNAIKAESENILDIAELLDIVDAKTIYETALDNLSTELNKWVGRDSYPITVSITDRQNISSVFSSEASARARLIDEISKTNSEISASAVKSQIDEEISEFTETLSGLNTSVSEILSDNYVTIVESQSLKLSLNLLVSEALDVIDIAEALVKDPDTINLESKITDYSEAILALQTLLGSFIDKTTYPIAITEQQRIDIDAAFSGVISARVALSKGISDSLDNNIQLDLTEYIGEVVSPINESIGGILTDISNISSNGYVSFPESETIRSAVVNIQSGCEDLIDIAELLETEIDPITEKSDLEDALVGLLAVTSPFIGQTIYPIAITTQQRDDIQDSFVATQTAKFKLIQKIQATQISVSATEVRGYIDEELGDVDTAISGLSTLATNTSSDGYITLAEVNALKIALAQVQSESLDIISIAAANNITTEKTNYQSAITALESTIGLWLDRESYPIAILPEQRIAIVEAVESVYATKTILRNAITTKLDSGVSEAINEIISGEVEDLNESIQGLSDNVTTWLSDDVVTTIEASSLKLAWVQVDSESTDVISVASTVGVASNVITAYSGALSTLYSQLSSFIDQTTYPIEITSLQRQGIADSFADVQSTKTTLLNAIETVRIQSTIEYVNQQVSELDSALSGLYNTVFEWVPGVSVTENESEDAASRLSSLTTEVNDVVAIATGLSITTETANLSDSLDALSDLLLVYIDQLSYPVTLTSDDQQDILDAITDVRSKKTFLLDAINEKRLADLYSYIDEQVGDTEEALAATNETVAKILSDDYVSLSEAQSLALSLERLDSETDTLIDLAQSLNLGISGVFDCLDLFDTDIVVLDGGEDLESSGVSVVNNMSTEATEFESAITALRSLLTPWINQASYPIAISQAQRNSITASFEDVELKRLALVAAIETYKNIDVSDYAEDRILNLIDSNDATTELLRQISSDGYVSYDESVSLQLSFITLEGECETLIDVAELLEVDATQLSEDLSLLQTLVGRWVDLPNYPEAITEEDRSALANAYVALQISKTQIADAISTAKANGVAASLSEFQQYVDEELGEANEAIGATNTLLTSSLSDGYITLKEANSLKLSFNRLDSEVGDLITIATGLGITTEATALTNAIDSLEVIITTWTTKSEYPAVITSQNRLDITAAFTLVETTKVALVNAITVKLDNNLSTDISGYIDEQIGDIEEALGTINQNISDFSSDLKITASEAQTLNLSYIQLSGECEDLIETAALLEIATEATALDTYLDTLASTLSVWINQETYPISITAQQRTSILDAFENVEKAKSVLINKIAETRASNVSATLSEFQEYVDGEFGDYDETIGQLQTDVSNISNDGYLTLAEANALELSIARMDSEATDLVALATTLEITTPKTNYSNAILAIKTELESWTNQSTYPVAITSQQRAGIASKFNTAETTKVALNDAIVKKLDSNLSTDISGYVDEQIGDVEELISAAEGRIDDILSDGYVTTAEAVNLKILKIQLDGECEDLLAVGVILELSDENAALNAALLSLASAVGSFIDQSSYPVEITGIQRTAIETAFDSVQTAKSSLINAIAAQRAALVSADLSAYQEIVDGNISDVNESLGNLETLTNNFSSDLFITRAEANSVSIALTQVESESADILDTAEELVVESGDQMDIARINYITALGELSSVLNNFVGKTTYPIAITALQRSDIGDKFESVQSTKSILINSITQKKIINNTDFMEGYIDGKISDINETLSGISSVVSNSFSGGYITYSEASMLKYNYNQIYEEAARIETWATELGITVEKEALVLAVSNLHTLLLDYIDKPEYPIEISSDAREAILNSLTSIAYAKSILVKKISDTTNTNITEEFKSHLSEAVVEFVSKTRIGIFGSVRGSQGAIWCSGELLIADLSDDVTTSYPVLNYIDGNIVPTYIEPNTEYYIYIANYKSSEFDVESLPASGDKPSTAAKDFRGNLFLSQTPDYNGTLGETEPGLNARVVGKCETDGTDYSEGGPYFIREINMSIIGRNVDLSQAFTEYSDYQLVFVDQNTLSFQKFDGTRGLCYIAGQLLELGNGLEVDTNDYRVIWNGGYLNPMSLDTSAIAANTTYQIYLPNDEDSYNFNDINPGTGRPYQESDIGYVAAKDKRRQLFLSTKEHDHRLLDEAYPGYFARHIGQVQTDDNGYFKYAADISLIRQPTLNPTSLDGLAECVIQDVSTTQFKVIRKKGTTGIIYVGGKPVQTYDADNPLVHIVTTSDALYEYDETEIDAPLTDSGLSVAEKPGVSIYLYMANDIAAWDGITTFCSLQAPSGGYLSTNWPGNQSRWLATIQLAPDTVGSELVTNGGFATDSDWTKGTGWAYSSPNQNMVHTPGNSASLSQDVGAVADTLYACTFYITGRTAGIAAPRIGGTSGQSISGNTSSTQYLLAINTGNLEIVPDTYFDGTVDNVSVKKVLTGQFSGTYIKDSVGGVSAQIDDSIVSTSTTYSSNKIEQIRQQLLGKIALALGLNGSHTSGLDLQLEYVDSTTIKLRAVSADVDVVFPNLEVVTVTTTGINKTITGNTSTTYYVYLVTDGTLTISTDAPTDEYSSISFYGDTQVLVGWMSFSATDTIAGTHNVYSFWNEPTRTYSALITGATTTVTVTGLLVPPNKTASVSRTGTTTATGREMFNSGASGPLGTVSATVSVGNQTSTDYTVDSLYQNIFWEPGCGGGNAYVIQISLTATLSATSLTTGIYNSVSLTHSLTSSHCTSFKYWVEYPATETCAYIGNSSVVSYSSFSGELVITRPGS